MQVRQRSDFQRMIRLCVDSYDNDVPAGRFYHPCGGSYMFHSLSQLLVRLEHILEEASFPQSFTSGRVFAPVSPLEWGKAEWCRK